jgi:hypothetical protein
MMYRRALSDLQDPAPLTWVAADGDRIVGTVRLIPVPYPNGAHRADVSKFLVRRETCGPRPPSCTRTSECREEAQTG